MMKTFRKLSTLLVVAGFQVAAQTPPHQATAAPPRGHAQQMHAAGAGGSHPSSGTPRHPTQNSLPTGTFNWEGRRPPSQNSEVFRPRQPSGAEIGGLIVNSVLQGLATIPQPTYQPQPTYVQPQPTYYQAQPAPVYTAPAPVAPVVSVPTPPPPAPLPKNVASPPKLKANSLNLAFDDPQAMSAGDYLALRSVLDELVQNQMTDLGDALNTMGVGDDSNVRAALEDMQVQINNGLPITDAQVANLQQAIDGAAAARGLTISGADVANLSGILGGLETSTQIATLFDANYPSGGFDPTLPTGLTNLAMIPGLPADQIYCLPNGALVSGTANGAEMAYCQTQSADLLGMPVGSGNATAGTISDPDPIQSGVMLINLPETEFSVQFRLLGEISTLEPGAMQVIPKGANQTIEFDRGDGSAAAKYTLENGAYVFVVKSGRWELVQRTFKAVISNAGNDSPFYFQIDGRPAQLAADEQVEYESRYPMVFKFNRGEDGQDAERCFVQSKLNLQLALDPADRLWDLFDAAAVQLPEKSDEVQLAHRGASESRTGRTSLSGAKDSKAAAVRQALSKTRNGRDFSLSQFRKAFAESK